MVEESKYSVIRDMLKEKRKTEALTKWQLESIHIINQILQALGWYIDIDKTKDGKIQVIIHELFNPPLINERGITSIHHALEKIINPNTFLSNISDKEVNDIMFDHMVAVIGDLAENYDYYGCNSVANMESVRSTIENMSEIALARGRKGVTLEYLKTIQKIKEIIRGKLEKEGGIL